MKKFFISLIGLSIFGLAISQVSVDNLKLRRWNPGEGKEQAAEKMLELKEQMASSAARFGTLGTSTRKAPSRVASTDKDILPIYTIDDGTRINFNLVNWFMGDFIGIGSIRPVNDTPVECALNGLAVSPGIYADGKLYGCTYTSGGGVVMAASFQEYDATTGRKLKDIKLPAQWYSVFTDGAYNPADGKIYVMGYDGGHVPYLAVLNTETGTYIDDWAVFCPVSVASMDFDNDGTLYAITGGGELVTISLETGEGTPLFRVEPEGTGIYHWQAITFDRHTGELFWIRSSELFETDLRRINIDSKTVEVISDLPDFGAIGAWVVSPEAPAKAPNTIAALAAEFEGNSTTGNITFTAPSTTFDGSSLSGSVDVSILVDGNVVDERTLSPGESATVSCVNFGKAGEHKLSAEVSNTEGNGPTGTVMAYCGLDTPRPVENLDLSISVSGMASLTWDAPTTGIHEGYFDPSVLTYKVVRYPGRVTVADALTDTRFEEQLEPELNKYYYEVTASMDGKKSQTVASNTVVFGDGLDIPFNAALGDDLFNLATIYDIDGDGNGWYETWGTVSCTTGWHEAGYYSEDWFITPPFKMTPGNYYMKTNYMYQSVTPSELTVTFGKGTSIEDQTQVMMTANPRTEDYSLIPIEGYVKVEEEGNYSFGFKLSSTSIGSISTPYLTIYEMLVEQGPEDGAPSEVTGITAQPFPKGELKAKLTFTTPATDFSGTALSGLDKVEICDENGRTVGTLTDVAPGTQYTFVDENAKQGFNTYFIYAYNEHGRGKHNKTDVYVGNDIPDMISYLKYNVTDNKVISFNWGAPGETGVRGGYVDPETLRYDFCRSEVDYVEPFPVENGQGLRTTSFTWTEEGNWEEDPQYMIFYGVKAVNPIGEGPLGYTAVVLGKPVQTPFVESFKSGYLGSMVWRLESIKGENAWNITSGPTGDGIVPSDRDGGMVHFLTLDSFGETQQALVTPLFELKDMQKPVLIFDMYHKADAPSDALLSVQISSDDAPYAPLGDYIFVKSSATGWQTHVVPLDAYNGKDRLFIALIGATFAEGCSFAIDNIRICDNVPADLSIEAFTGPDNMELEDTGVFSVTLVSKGVETASGYTVDIYADGVLAGSAEGAPLNLSERTTVTVDVKPTAANARKDVKFEARVNLDGDANEADNTALLIVPVGGSRLPAPRDITATAEGDEIELNWTAPGDPQSETLTEGFEDYEAFAITSQGSWKFYDGDQLYPYGIGNLTYPHMDEPRAFMIWAPASIGFDELPWQPLTGEQCLIAFSSSYQKVNGDIDFYELSDEWLISPRVVGGTEVSFQAAAPYDGFIERFEFLISSTDRNPESFTIVGDQTVIDKGGWNRYSYTLPEDARYFAIRYVSFGYEAFALLIDDITYTAGYDKATLIGYNLYVNGVRANEEPIAVPQAKTACERNAEYELGVSALYEEGESELAMVRVTTGIDGESAAEVNIRTDGNTIVIENAFGMPVTVYNAAGLVMTSIAYGTGYDVTAPLPSGVYMVKAANRSYKIFIK